MLQRIPKNPGCGANCDETFAALLDDLVAKNDVCCALVAYQITANEIQLTYDPDHCQEKQP